MKVENNTSPCTIGIWVLALGYFAFYIPYAALTKALSSNLLASKGWVDTSEPIGAAGFLPLVLFGTIITMPAIIYFSGWYRYLVREQVLPTQGLGIVSSRGITPWIILSGVSFALIIATTTLAYSFQGVSIVFALLLMRGGVLVMSPLIDKVFSREVHWYSWAGLVLTLFSVGFALAKVDEYYMGWPVLLNLGAYLTGYIFRLQMMTRYAKDAQESLNRRFFVAENTVAMITLTLLAIGTLFFYLINKNIHLMAFFQQMVATGILWPALLIGVFYGFLGVFGSLIYLNRRENTFSIPVNRSASLLSGVFATLLLWYLFDGQTLSTVQIIGALTIALGLCVMSYFDLRQIREHPHSLHNPLQKIWLFICDGNRMRSPMAAALCNKALAAHFGQDLRGSRADIYADSAALRLGQHRGMPEAAKHAMQELGIGLENHEAKQVTAMQMHRAEKIFCMNEAQRDSLNRQFPWAAQKVMILGGEKEIAPPTGTEKHHFMDLAHTLNQYVQNALRGVVPKASTMDWSGGIK